MMPGLLALIGVLILTMQVMAGVWTPNNFSYKPDEGARGKQEKVRFDSGSDRIDARLGKEIWVGDPNYGPTLQGAIAAIGATAAILRLPTGTHSINADLTIPANVTLAMERGAILTIVTGKTLTINGGLEAGLYQIFSCIGTGSVDLRYNRSIKEIYTEWWGAKADGTTDSTAAFQSAFNAVGDFYTDQVIDTILLSGTYKVHEVTRRAPKGMLIGREPGATVVQYNGNGGAGSYVLRHYDALELMPVVGLPWGGLKNLKISGFNEGVVGGKIAEHCFMQNGGIEPDWGQKFDNVYFSQCFGDALVFEKDVINLHFNRIRFDGVGGFCMAFSGGAGGENRPISIYQWTFDNNASDEFFAAATAAGYYDGFRWSKGLISLTDMPGVQLHISDGRIELNKRLLPANGTTKCMILVNDTSGGNTASIHLENLSGYFQARDAGIVVKDLTCLCNAVFNNVLMNSAAKLYETGIAAFSADTVHYRSDRPGDRTFGASNIKANEYRQREQGIFVNGRMIEFCETPNPFSTSTYMKGDLIINRSPSATSTVEGWRVIAPVQGYAIPIAPSITTAGVVTAPSKVVTLPTAAAWQWLGTGANIKLAGAGPASAELLTYVTAIDPDGLTITINDAPATSVNPCTITMQAPTFKVMGAHSGATADRPTLTINDSGFCYWDTDKGKAIFWNGSAWKLADGTAP